MLRPISPQKIIFEDDDSEMRILLNDVNKFLSKVKDNTKENLKKNAKKSDFKALAMQSDEKKKSKPSILNSKTNTPSDSKRKYNINKDLYSPVLSQKAMKKKSE